MYLKIANNGEVEAEAFTLLGASTKRGDSEKIGMFGSGTKYAMAYFMRNNIGIRIFSGTNEIKVSTVKKSFRKEEFDVITIDGKETSITTKSGPKWKLWQAIREIYANALDEGLTAFEKVFVPEPELGRTCIYLKIDSDVMEFYKNIDRYFAMNKTVLFESEEGKIYAKVGEKAIIYRKGIKCYDSKRKSCFDYDLENATINESRIADPSYRMFENIATLLYKCDKPSIIKKVIENIDSSDYQEQSLKGSSISTNFDDLSDAWNEAVETKYVAPAVMMLFLEDYEAKNCTFLPNFLYDDFIAKFGKDRKAPSLQNNAKGFYYKAVSPTELELMMLKSVLKFFKECDFEINYPIDIVEFDNKDIHGKAHEGKILINQIAFEQGKKWIANIIIEEYIHLKHEAGDRTRKFQDAIINEMLTYMQKNNSYLL